MAAVADFLASKKSGTAATAITVCYVCSTFALTFPHVASRPPHFAQGDLKRGRRGPSVNAALDILLNLSIDQCPSIWNQTEGLLSIKEPLEPRAQAPHSDKSLY